MLGNEQLLTCRLEQGDHLVQVRASPDLELTELLDRRTKELSGGQKQPVALGRAMARKPAVFLMDEPLSNLDAKLRNSTRAHIVELQRQLGTTTVYVTHDQVEAMTMGHRIAVLNQGKLQQLGTRWSFTAGQRICSLPSSLAAHPWRFCRSQRGPLQRCSSARIG